MVANSEPDERRGDQEGASKQTPAGGEHGEERDAIRVEGPENSSTSGLDTLVETSQVGSLTTGVGQSTHVPVDAGLPDGIEEAVEEVEEHATEVVAVLPVDPGEVVEAISAVHNSIFTCGLILLPGVTSAPDAHGEDKEEDERDSSTLGASEALHVEEVTVDDGADDLRKPVQEVVEGSGANGEVGAVEVVHLVGVEDVGGEEHGEEQENNGLLGKSLPETEKLSRPGGVLHQDDLGAVFANDTVTVDKEHGNNSASEHKNDEGNVGAVVDRGGTRAVDGLGKRDQSANDGTKVEDDPEERNVLALVFLGRVGHHNSTLGAPQKTSADTEESTGKDDEALVVSVVPGEERGGVDAVTKTTKGGGKADSETVGDGACKEANNGEGAVQGHVGLAVGRAVTGTSTAKSTEGVEHARAEEAHDGDHEQLDLRRGKPNTAANERELLVDPSLGEVVVGGQGSVVVLGDIVLWCLGLGHSSLGGIDVLVVRHGEGGLEQLRWLCASQG